MADNLGLALKRKQEEEKLKRKGLGVVPKFGEGAEQLQVVGGRAVGVPVRPVVAPTLPRTSRDTGYIPEEAVGGFPQRLEAEGGQAKSVFITPSQGEPTESGDMQPEMAVSHSGIPAGKQVEAEPGAGAVATDDTAGGIYAPEYPSGEVDQSVPEPGRGVRVAPTTKGGLNKVALNKALLATGLNLMARGGRTYDRPTSAASIVGESGLAGVQAYDQEKAIQDKKAITEQALEKGQVSLEASRVELANAPMKTEAARLAIQNAKISLADAKISHDQKVKASTILDSLATETDPKKYADLQKRYLAMAGKTGKPTTRNLQQVKEKVKIGVDAIGEDLYEERSVGFFDPTTGKKTLYEQAGGKGLLGAGTGKTLDSGNPEHRQIAQGFLNEAKGNRKLAEQLAREAGYTL